MRGRARGFGYNYLFLSNVLRRFAARFTPTRRPQSNAMPIYEYRCSSCGDELEVLQKITEPLLVTCPACGKDALVKQVSAAGFQLKGSGWYVTDFRDGSKPAAKSGAKPDAKAATPAKGEGAESKGADATAESKTEAKPARSPNRRRPRPPAAEPKPTAANSRRR